MLKKISPPPPYHNKYILSSTSPASFFEEKNQMLRLFGLECFTLVWFPIALSSKINAAFPSKQQAFQKYMADFNRLSERFDEEKINSRG